MGEAILHGLFSLRDGVSEHDFRAAFEAFVDHLTEVGFASGGRLMHRTPLAQFGKPLPEFQYYAAIMFLNPEREQACYDYVAENAEPVRSIHRAMNSLVRPQSSYFFVTAS
jgi:hypothetical protein